MQQVDTQSKQTELCGVAWKFSVMQTVSDFTWPSSLDGMAVKRESWFLVCVSLYGIVCVSNSRNMCLHVYSCMTVHEVRDSTPGTDSQHSGFHRFEVNKWVANITNSRWLRLEKCRISDKEGFHMVRACHSAEITEVIDVMSAVINGYINYLTTN